MIITFSILALLLLIIFLLINYSDRIRKTVALYQIEKGKHYSWRPITDWFRLPLKLGIIKGEKLLFTVIFSDGTNYSDWQTNDSINKLYGMTFGFDLHYRSMRIGWRHTGENTIELWAYWYNDGKRGWARLGEVPMFEEVKVSMERTNNRLVWISVWKESMTATGMLEKKEIIYNNAIGMNCPKSINFKLFPYAGGKLSAKDRMKIYIKEN